MNSKKWIYFPIFFSVLAVPAYFLMPLGENQYEIKFDQSEIDKRTNFINTTHPENKSKKPNIIILMADDLGKTDISLYGSKMVNTKNIDQLASEGITCTQGYVTSPVCSPSRASLLTGKYQQKFGFENQTQKRYPANRMEYLAFKYLMATDDWVVGDLAVPHKEDINKQGIPPTVFTFSELLKRNGYKTACIGKWHTGDAEHSLPHNRGFDYSYGFYEAFSLFAYEDDPDIVNHYVDEFTDPYIWKGQRDGNCAIRINGKEVIEKEYLTFKLAKEAVQFMEQNKDTSFLLYVPFNAPHTPLQAPKSYVEKYAHVKDPGKQVYFAMIEALDDAIGMIHDKVKELLIEENTLIIFLSDNGGATYTYTTDNTPLKGGKLTSFEGGLNIPFVMKWKGVIPENKKYNELVSSLDIASTAIQISNTQLPQDYKLDGKNLIPFLKDSAQQTPHTALFWKTGFIKIIRKGKWKLIQDSKHNQLMLYNLSVDESETNNIAAQFPDTVKLLLSDIEEWDKETVPALWPNILDFTIKEKNITHYFPS